MRRTLDFLLHDWLSIEELCGRDRFAEHSRDTFTSVLDTCERIARDVFAPAAQESDVNEPRLEAGRMKLPQGAQVTADAYRASGMLAAAQDYELGGLQLPYAVEMAANALFWEAGVGLGGGFMLSVSNANLLLAHGSPIQRRVFAHALLSGEFAGTMCLSEPQAGSSLADITTRALPDGEGAAEDPLGPRYRLFGNKMWISNGDHELTINIVHLVLAKIPGADGHLIPGSRGISLFIVPKFLVQADGTCTAERNDVAVAGLNHKMGYRGIPNTLLNFGEGRNPVRGSAGAVAYRVGEVGDGLRCMFHMMNEARIAVGLGAAAIAYAGFEASLRYARDRRQGRALTRDGKSTSSEATRIIEHPDVRRMLLAQKAYAEGGIALSLYCARLVDEIHTGNPDEEKDRRVLLELLTPIAKSWPSEWGLEANNLAIQVHGGYGYTRDFPVERYWRDNRLNMIHEGTHGIHGLDLLGRKVRLDQGRALQLLEQRIDATARSAAAVGATSAMAAALQSSFAQIKATIGLAWANGDHLEALANASPFLTAFGHVVVGWLWLDLALAANRKSATARTGADARVLGTLQTARYFFDYEMPKVTSWLTPVGARNLTCCEMQEEWFDG